ncbi:MAG: hypothetical protein ACRCYY_18375 [Trueperaceae bacterium]
MPRHYHDTAILEGNIAIEHVTIREAQGKPIYFACRDFPCHQNITYGHYDLTISGLEVESAFDTLVVSVPGKLTFQNSVIELKQPTINSQAFGDNVGIDVADLLGALLTFDNVDVYMESPRKKLDNGPLDYSAVPFIISNERASTTTTLTVKNCHTTFGIPDSNWSLATVKTFKLRAVSGATLKHRQQHRSNRTKRRTLRHNYRYTWWLRVMKAGSLLKKLKLFRARLTLNTTTYATLNYRPEWFYFAIVMTQILKHMELKRN